VALSRTNLLGQISPGNFGTGNFTSNSFTPSSSSLLVVAAAFVENSGSTTDPTSALTISGGSLTWTQQATAVASPTAFSSLVKVWTAPVTTGSSMTVTLSTSGRNAGLYGVSVVCYTGYDTGTPVGGTASGQQNGGFSGPPTPISLTLNAAPVTADEVFAAVFADKTTADTTAGSAFTEIDDLNNTNWGSLESEIRTGSTSTTVDWVDLRPSGGALFNFAAATIVIKAGGTTSNASAALAVTATLVAAATDTQAPAAALAVTATLAIAADRTAVASAALAVTATTAAGATLTKPLTAALAVTATLAAGTGTLQSAGAALAVTAVLLAAASVTPAGGPSAPGPTIRTVARDRTLRTAVRGG
jgi:hypothetical protein